MAYQERQAFERLASARVRRAGTEVRAPIGGVVFALAVSGPQEVVLPGEPILEIVPQDARLVVAARVDPGDVDQVFAGQQAKLRFTAFPARATPELDGHVARVSADAVQDPRTGLSWYDVELAVGPSPGDAGVVLAGDLPVAPGMPVEVHIQTAKRNLASFLVKPVSGLLPPGAARGVSVADTDESKAAPTIEMGIANDLRELAGVAARVDAFCAEHALDPQIPYAVNLSVEEILANTISYGYEADVDSPAAPDRDHPPHRARHPSRRAGRRQRSLRRRADAGR